MKAIFKIGEYAAIVPQIQNAYGPEKVTTGWQWGFKYCSGVFEFFTVKTLAEARCSYNLLLDAIEEYWA